MPLKCDEAHLLRTRDFVQSIVTKNRSGLVNQRSHRHEQLNRECVCSHFNKPVTVRRRSALKTGEAAQPGSIEQKMTQFVSKRHSAPAHPTGIITEEIQDYHRHIGRSPDAYTENVGVGQLDVLDFDRQSLDFVLDVDVF